MRRIVNHAYRRRGFSLLEVLVSLALGSLVLGVVLHDVSGHVVRLANVEPNYRAMLTANAVLERAMANHSTNAESGEENGLEYQIEANSVDADSRVMELKATVSASNGRSVNLSVYLLRSMMFGSDS